MSEEPTQVNAGEDEAALDAELEASINSVRAGQTLEAQPTGQTEETAPTGATGEAPSSEDTNPTGAAGESDETHGASQATGATGPMEFRVPEQGKFESDAAYEKRVELFDLVRRRRAATTPEAKEALTTQIRKAKGELKTFGGVERFIPQKEGTETVTPPTDAATADLDPSIAADRERLRQLGGATKEEVEEIIQQTRHEDAVRSDLNTFVGKHQELTDEDVREAFFEFVDTNYAWQGKSGKDLQAVLEMAFDNAFRPSESVQDRVLRAAGVQEKVNAMQFPGGTASKTGYSPEMQKSIDELKSAGMSEEKALELLSD